MSVLSRLVAFGVERTNRVVRSTLEFKRVVALPRRVPDPGGTPDPSIMESHAEFWTQLLRRPGGTQTLRPDQGWALSEMVRCRGLLAALDVGAGKCVAGDTEIFDGVSRRTAKELAGSSFTVVTMAEGHKIAYRAATATESGEKECVRLELAEGSESTLSYDHPVYTPGGWIPAGRLKKGDFVAAPRSIPEPARCTEASDAEVILAAYLLSDGSVTTGGTRFTNVTPAVIDEFTAVANQLGDGSRNIHATQKIPGSLRPLIMEAVACGISQREVGAIVGVTSGCVSQICRGVASNAYRRKAKTGVIRGRKRDGSLDITYSARGLQWYRLKWRIRGLSKHKRVPPEFWALPREQVALFLNRFWACDGYINQCGFGVTLASEGMIDDIKFMLSRLGIRASKRFRVAKCNGKAFQAWRLDFAGEDAVTFLAEVGFVLGKEPACFRLGEKLLSTRRNTNYDVVPIGFAEYKEMVVELGIRRGERKRRESVKCFLGATVGQMIGRDKFITFCQTFGYVGKYAWLASTELRWEKVDSVTAVGVKPVFDLSVPDTGCFVGDGIVLHNTLPHLLAATVLEAKRPLLMMPASALGKTMKIDLPQARQNWYVHEGLGFISYEKMARDGQHDLLKRTMPDLIAADEVHRLRNKNTAVWRRIERYAEDEFKEVKFVGLSGTVTVRSVKDYEHLIWLALRNGSPLPHRYVDLMDLADAIDEGVPEELRPSPGALWDLCVPGETPREGFRRRLQETAGYVFTRNPDLGCSLYVVEEPRDGAALPAVPAVITTALAGMRGEWATPSGDTITSPLEFASHVDELLLGFYYRWVWPDGKPDFEWLFARKAWRGFVRLAVKNSGAQSFYNENFVGVDGGRTVLGGAEFDTEMQVALACAHGRIKAAKHALAEPEAGDVYSEWVSHRDRLRAVLQARFGKKMREPPREAVWLDKYMVDFAERWIEKTKAGLLWTSKVAFLYELGLRGALVHGAGDDSIVEETETCAVSIAAHGEAKNLQAFNRNLLLEVPGNSKTVEQLIGRTHRSGQKADEVEVVVRLSAIEQWNRFDKARREARYVEDTTGSRQKLNYANISIASVEEVGQRMNSNPPNPLWRSEWAT